MTRITHSLISYISFIFSIIFSFVLLLCSVFTTAQAAEPAAARAEIAQLFTALETSNCQFNRNGTWYGAKEASAHLQTKYKYLQDKDLVPSAEKFIERAATESSLSGKAYQIKCADSVVQASGPWFRTVLEKYRAGVKAK
jgi:glycerol-3-phosphate dehydrogenase